MTKREFPGVGDGPGYYLHDRTIMPTLSKQGYFSFGVRLLSPIPAIRQLAGILEDLTVVLTPVTENHVGDPVEFYLLKYVNLPELQDTLLRL